MSDETTKKLKILAIIPAHRPHSPKKFYPIGFGYVLSALQRAGYDFELLDIEAERYSNDEVDAILARTEYDLVLIGALVTAYKYVKDQAARARRARPDCLIVAGNSVATSIPEHLLRHTEVDIAVDAEADDTLIELVRAISEGRDPETVLGLTIKKGDTIITTDPRPVISDISTIPIPDWDIFNMEKYLDAAVHDVPEPHPIPREQLRPFVLNTARGCPYKCTFCYHVFIKEKYRWRSPQSILDEVRLLQERYGINFINFFDELTFFSLKQTEEFIDALLESGLKFFWCADVRSNLYREKDLPLLRKMKRAGCLALGYSLESGDQDILKSMNKKLKVEDFKRQKLALDKAGIRTFTSLVFGYPEETVESIRRTLQICYDLDVYPSAGFLLPQPATPMYTLAREMGRIGDEEDYFMKLGDRQDLTVNLSSLPDAELKREVEEGLQRISDKLKMGFEGESLIKTGTYKTSQIKGDEENSPLFSSHG